MGDSSAQKRYCQKSVAADVHPLYTPEFPGARYRTHFPAPDNYRAVSTLHRSMDARFWVRLRFSPSVWLTSNRVVPVFHSLEAVALVPLMRKILVGSCDALQF